MILTTMVVTLSLPMPSTDVCRSVLDGMNREIGAIADVVRNEWAESVPESFRSLTEQADANAAEADRTETASLDQAFRALQEEFVNETLALPIEQAKKDVKAIAIEPVRHELPPAPAAAEVLPSVAELIRSVMDEVPVHAGDSITYEWADTVENRSRAEAEIDLAGIFAEAIVRSVDSADIGPWANQLAGIETDREPAFEVTASIAPVTTAEKSEVAVAVDSMSTEWEAVAKIATRSEVKEETTIATLPPTTDDHGAPAATVKNAFRKTAEAVALWTKVLARPF
jgi:hypothetical protein